MHAVRSIDGPSKAEMLVTDLETSIRDASLPPGHPLPITELAEQHGLRHPALEQMLSRLERARLLVVQGGAVSVAPLDAGELQSICRLRRVVELSIFERSHELISPRELDRLEALLPDHSGPTDQVRVDPAEWGAAMSQLSLGLARPGATEAEMRLLTDVMLGSRRYNAHGWKVIEQNGSGQPTVAIELRREHLARCHDLIDSFRMGEIRFIRENVNRHDDDADMAGTESLVPVNTTDPETARPRLRVVRGALR